MVGDDGGVGGDIENTTSPFELSWTESRTVESMVDQMDNDPDSPNYYILSKALPSVKSLGHPESRQVRSKMSKNRWESTPWFQSLWGLMEWTFWVPYCPTGICWYLTSWRSVIWKVRLLEMIICYLVGPWNVMQLPLRWWSCLVGYQDSKELHLRIYERDYLGHAREIDIVLDELTSQWKLVSGHGTLYTRLSCRGFVDAKWIVFNPKWIRIQLSRMTRQSVGRILCLPIHLKKKWSVLWSGRRHRLMILTRRSKGDG